MGKDLTNFNVLIAANLSLSTRFGRIMVRKLSSLLCCYTDGQNSIYEYLYFCLSDAMHGQNINLPVCLCVCMYVCISLVQLKKRCSVRILQLLFTTHVIAE